MFFKLFIKRFDDLINVHLTLITLMTKEHLFNVFI